MAIGSFSFFDFSLVNHVAKESVGQPQKDKELYRRYVHAGWSHTGRCRHTPSPALNRCGMQSPMMFLVSSAGVGVGLFNHSLAL